MCASNRLSELPCHCVSNKQPMATMDLKRAIFITQGIPVSCEAILGYSQEEMATLNGPFRVRCFIMGQFLYM